MTEKKKKSLKRIIFPIGIFLLLFLTQSILGIGGIVTYFYFSGKKNITGIEAYTVNYSKTMAEAFARVAELSYVSKKYTPLYTLFHEKIEENTVDEALFVLADGSLIVHSNTSTEKELMGNIAVDEMSYNLDMILKPVYTKSTELFVNNYNIINKKVPFKKQERELLKKYIYGDIDSTGWLFTKGVFIKDKPAGAVSFIVGKERIYSYIQGILKQTRRYSIIALAASIILSFFISIIIFFRYRSIQKNALAFAVAPAAEERVAEEHEQTGKTAAPAATEPESFNEEDMEIDLTTEKDVDIVLVEDESIPSIETVAEENEAPVTPAVKHAAAPDEDEMITVELLGEIDYEPEPSVHEAVQLKPHKYIAPVINLEDYKNHMAGEIRDAIPIRKKG